MTSYLLLLLNVLPDQEEEPHPRINNFLFGYSSENEQFLNPFSYLLKFLFLAIDFGVFKLENK